MEPRKATDVLLDVESKVNTLLDLVRAQDLVIKVLSNKLNDVIGRLDKQAEAPPRIIMETTQTLPRPSNMPPGFVQLPAGDPERTIPITAESALPQSDSPQGFRRSSRPETYAPKAIPQIPLQQPAPKPEPTEDFVEYKMPMQIPQGSVQQSPAKPPPGRGSGSEVSAVPQQGATTSKNGAGAVMAPPQPVLEPAPALHTQGQIPVMQRCVNKNSKAIFLADVEIVDLATSQPIFKTRTNGAGKWQAALNIGAYRVTVHKRESVTKEKIEAVQDIQIDGTQPRVELPMLIIK